MDWVEEILKGVPAKKTDAELKMEDALHRYEQKFGKPFPIGYGTASYGNGDDITAIVEKHIKAGIPAPEPHYDADKVY